MVKLQCGECKKTFDYPAYIIDDFTNNRGQRTTVANPVCPYCKKRLYYNRG